VGTRSVSCSQRRGGRRGHAGLRCLARASHVVLVGLFVIAALWCAYAARPVIVPVVLAWVIATIVLPVIK
jgi:predicted PurR-regulated permease PerM